MSPEHIKVIEDVASALCKDNSFDIYDQDDIAQEIFLICAELLDGYNEEKGELFPYLLGASRNRLISFKRMHYYNPQSSIGTDKLALLNPVPIFDTDLVDDSLESYTKEYDEHIDSIIPSYLRENYLKMKEGVKVPRKIKMELLEYVSECIEHFESKQNVNND